MLGCERGLLFAWAPFLDGRGGEVEGVFQADHLACRAQAFEAGAFFFELVFAVAEGFDREADAALDLVRKSLKEL